MTVIVEAPRVERVQEVQRRIVADCQAIRILWLDLAGHLYEFFEGQMWTQLGYETFNDWLATPEIDLGRTQVYNLIEAYRELVIEREVDREQLGELEISKVAVVLPALRSGDIELGELIADCKALRRVDLRMKYRHLLANSGDRAARARRARAALRREEAEKAIKRAVKKVGGARAEFYAMSERIQDVVAQAQREAPGPEAREAAARAGEYARKMRDEAVRLLGVQ